MDQRTDGVEEHGARRGLQRMDHGRCPGFTSTFTQGFIPVVLGNSKTTGRGTGGVPEDDWNKALGSSP